MYKLCYRIIVLCGFLLLLTACNSSLNKTDNAPDVTNNERAASLNVQLGLGYLQQGNVQRAKSKLLLALQQAPDYPPALSAMGYYLEQTGESKQAEDYYRKAVNKAPADGAAQNNYGTYLCRNGRLQESLDRFLLAVKDPNYLSSAEAYENAGLCSLKIPDNKLAQEYFQKAILQDPQRTASLLELAKLSYKQNNFQAANNYMQRYLQYAKPNAEINNLEQQIKQGLSRTKVAANSLK